MRKKDHQPVLTALKASTTVLFLRTSDADFPAWEKAIKAVWTISPIEVRSVSEIGEYEEEMAKPSGFSFLTIVPMETLYDGFRTQEPRLQLWIPWSEPEYRYNQERFDRTLAYIPLDVSIPVANCNMQYAYMKPDTSCSVFRSLYTDAVIRNWTPQQIANGLRVMDKRLQDGKIFLGTQRRWDEAAFPTVFEGTIYICDNALEQWDLDKHKGWFVVDSKKDLLLTCPKRIVRISPMELEAKLAAKEEFYYVTAIRWGRDQLIWVQHSTTGEVVYFNTGYHLQTANMAKDLCSGKL